MWTDQVQEVKTINTKRTTSSSCGFAVPLSDILLFTSRCLGKGVPQTDHSESAWTILIMIHVSQRFQLIAIIIYWASTMKERGANIGQTGANFSVPLMQSHRQTTVLYFHLSLPLTTEPSVGSIDSSATPPHLTKQEQSNGIWRLQTRVPLLLVITKRFMQDRVLYPTAILRKRSSSTWSSYQIRLAPPCLCHKSRPLSISPRVRGPAWLPTYPRTCRRSNSKPVCCPADVKEACQPLLSLRL